MAPLDRGELAPEYFDEEVARSARRLEHTRLDALRIGADQVEQVRLAMDARGSLTLFPESTTSDGTGLLPFKSALLSALDPLPEGVVVQPVLLAYDDAERIAALKADGTISGGMIPKVETCVAAVEAGVDAAVILDGRVPHAMLLEIFTSAGAGTLVHG